MLNSKLIRVFIGCDESQEVAAKVLQFSIRRHSTLPVEFHLLNQHPLSFPRQRRHRGRTGFSFQRFLIPQIAGYSGKAIYLDADMQVFGDIAELWKMPLGSHKVLCSVQHEVPTAWKNNSFFRPGRQMSVLILDCSSLKWDIEEIVRGLDEGRYDYKDLMFKFCVVPSEEIGETVPPSWNCLEYFDPKRTKLLHYTVTPEQPWKNDKNPLYHLWEGCFREAVLEGAVHPKEVLEGIEKGHLKTSLIQYIPKNRRPVSLGAIQRASVLGWCRRTRERILNKIR
jgi:hypothetical protein